MINPIHTYPSVNQSSNSESTASSKKQSQMFKNILDEVAGHSGETVSKSLTQPLGEISSPMNIRIQEPAKSFHIQTQTEELLAKLELYSSQLENSEVSLREMGSFLEDIYTNAQDLLQETKNMEGENEGEAALMDIACQCAITAQSEYIKFQRGDYL